MGNERSHLAGLELDEDAVEVTENWSMYSARVNNGNNSKLSVFISPMFPGLAKPSSPSLMQAAKNLMIHRHPFIVKFVSSWSHGGRFHLATEEVYSLSQVLHEQTPLQVCLGLCSILKALVFLHEKAEASHNNVCCASVYVSPDGTWKLGGFEFLCSFRDLSAARLQQMRAHRYERGVAPEEDGTLAHHTAIDQFAFGVLVEEVLKRKNEGEEELHAVSEFRELARRQLQNIEPSLRPLLPPLLDHPFFAHQFLQVHSFLIELPLKSEVERQNFFRSLPAQLAEFPEDVVATQLVNLLLGRMVLLDVTAQEHLLPALLKPQSLDNQQSEEPNVRGVFSMPVFRQHVVPRLLEMLCVRDAQVRLLLLSHFRQFSTAFTPDQLQTSVLPELLVGIKDTNDALVSMTLRALAELVPVLGASVVIGGKRGRLFTDGRPKARRSPTKEIRRRHDTISVKAKVVSLIESEVPRNDPGEYGTDLPERPSPDGGEAEAGSSDRGDEEAWSDWDLNDASSAINPVVNGINNETEGNTLPEAVCTEVSPVTEVSISVASLPDITALDIKNLTTPSTSDEVDFFQDMEPVISKTHVVQVKQINNLNSPKVTVSRSKGSLFDVASVGAEGDAWGEDISDWGLEEDVCELSQKGNS